MTHTNNYFTLEITPDLTTTHLKMQLHEDFVSTYMLPQTHKLLKFYLPSILRSKCFNENNYPFSKEVRRTEIGHLFEHILLEYLCNLKVEAGHGSPIHNGLTSWDWEKDERGVFHITIDAGHSDHEYFAGALEQAVLLTVRIMQSRKRRVVQPVVYSYLSGRASDNDFT